MQNIIDQRTPILSKRNVAVPNYLSIMDSRRLKAYSILDYYYAGNSKQVLTLEKSLYDNYIDIGLVQQLADKIANLVLYGFGLSSKIGIDAEILDNWIYTSNLYNTLLKAETYASVYGDAFIKVSYDYDIQSIVYSCINPASCFITDDNTIYIMTQDIENRDSVFIEQYTKDNNTVYMRSGYISLLNSYTALGNAINPIHQITTDFIELSISRLPIIHIANKKAEDGYGTSDFANALDLIDIYNQILTDKKIGSRYCALPAIFLSGSHSLRVDPTTGKVKAYYSPNSWYDLGQNGNVTKVDNSNALDMLQKEEQIVYNNILRSIGLSKAGIGETDVSNARVYQIKLQYAPTQQLIDSKRYDRTKAYKQILRVVYELWNNIDSAACTKVLGDDINSLQIRYDDILPIDTNDILQQLSIAKTNGGISNKTYIAECIKVLGINSTVEDELLNIRQESTLEKYM